MVIATQRDIQSGTSQILQQVWGEKMFFGVSAVSAQQHDTINFPVAPSADSPALPFQTDSAGSEQVPFAFPVVDGCIERSCSALCDPEVLAIRQNQLRLPSPRIRHAATGRARRKVRFSLCPFSIDFRDSVAIL